MKKYFVSFTNVLNYKKIEIGGYSEEEINNDIENMKKINMINNKDWIYKIYTVEF